MDGGPIHWKCLQCGSHLELHGSILTKDLGKTSCAECTGQNCAWLLLGGECASTYCVPKTMVGFYQQQIHLRNSNCSVLSVRQCPPPSTGCNTPGDDSSCITVKCENGYQNVNGTCQPICDCSPSKGFCFLPNQCICRRGYLGASCNATCPLCTLNDNCPSVELPLKSPNSCPACPHNLTDIFCHRCKTGFVKITESNGTRCIQCSDYCHNHSGVCNYEAIREVSCVNCAHNTTDYRCRSCKVGHYRNASQPLTSACLSCPCNNNFRGQHATCDPFSGFHCVCSSNTRTPEKCLQRDFKTMTEPDRSYCLQAQCSQCSAGEGVPIDHRLCYAVVGRGVWHCFTNDCPLGSSCYIRETPSCELLHQSQLQWAVIQPTISNVKIKIVIEIVVLSPDKTKPKESAEIYFASSFKPFLLPPDATLRYSEIHLDLFNRTTKFPDLQSSRPFKVVTHDGPHSLSAHFSLRSTDEILHIKNIFTNVIVLEVDPFHGDDAAASHSINLNVDKFYILLRSSPNSFGRIRTDQPLLYLSPLLGLGIFVAALSPLLVLNFTLCSWRNIRNLQRESLLNHNQFEQIPVTDVTILLDGQQHTVSYANKFQQSIFSTQHLGPNKRRAICTVALVLPSSQRLCFGSTFISFNKSA